MALEATRTPVPSLVSSTRRAARVDPLDAFAAAAGAETRALWLRPAGGEALVGTGSVCTFSGDVLSAWRTLTANSANASGPVLIGGLAFDPSAPSSALWAGFSTSRFVLPEQLLHLHSGVAWLTTNTVSGPQSLLSAPPPTTPGRTGLGQTAWRDLVAEVAGGIRDGTLGANKVVLARTHQVQTKDSIETVVRRLAAGYPACTIFAIEVRGACFVGATPERLVALQDRTATTMALAGSGPRGASPDDDARLSAALLADKKERAEHAVVVQALREDLAPIATRVIADAEPRIHTLPNLHHLITPVRAQVKPGCDVLDLVAHLHPTPAVGGYPRQRALEVIRQREQLDRGWYAAPLGWVGATGQGEFVVGLRSALVRDGVATLFAGCGIVGDSDPETELAESGWKLRPMLSALGVDA